MWRGAARGGLERAGEAAENGFGWTVDGVGDIDGDGADDSIIGATAAPSGAGKAYVRLSNLHGPYYYCTAKVNSQGCTPEIGAQGTPSLSIAGDFHVVAEDVLNQQFGVLFWGHGAKDVPYMGGTLCVAGPLVRTPVQHSRGNPGPPDCSGSYDFHFSHAYLAGVGAIAGDRIHTQYWSRDPADSFSVGLTDAVVFEVVP